MEKSYICPSCGYHLLKVTIIENGNDIEKYYCDICNNSYYESELISNDKVKLIKDFPSTKTAKKVKRGRKPNSSKKSSAKNPVKKMKKPESRR